jgi:2-oxoglutarate dehydrogenase E2 component (dihydrolipoamide succinyltransferase)
MIIEIKAPSPGESITQVLLASWLVEDNSFVEKDAEIAEIESDKATLVVYATSAGSVHQIVKAGETIDVGVVIATIDVAAVQNEKQKSSEIKTPTTALNTEVSIKPSVEIPEGLHITPLARQLINQQNIPAERLMKLHKTRITRTDINQMIQGRDTSMNDDPGRSFDRIKMSPLRRKLAERLVSVKNETAMLTTFNEVNMSAITDIRKNYGERFTKKHGYNIGFISFFAKAAGLGFAAFPQINACIDGEDILYYHYADICIAVSTPKGLLAPAIRNVQDMGLAEIEHQIRDFAARAKENRITLEELNGGTFTISNGGTFGSMLSTPIINPPQSAILGMHKIQERPIAIEGKVVIQPMMYIALSYDHRLIDGKESVGFVVRIKELLENPLLMLPDTKGSIEQLLGL